MWKGAATKVNVLARANSGRQSSMRRLDAWGVFFCGGSKPVIRVLKELHEESLDGAMAKVRCVYYRKTLPSNHFQL